VDSNIRGPHVENLHDGHRTGRIRCRAARFRRFRRAPQRNDDRSAEVSNVDQIGLVCNGVLWTLLADPRPRYVLHYYYDPSYFPGRGYNYYAGPGYYDRGYGYGGPRFTIRGW